CWSLTMVVTVKYVLFIMRADNEGEGGIYALTSLFLGNGRQKVTARTTHILTLLAIGGAALLYGDGIITPAISVLSAVEGLKVVTTASTPLVLPLTCAILFGLFMVQRQGTERIGRAFGPVMLLWFATIGTMGLVQLLARPEILAALDPRYAVAFFVANRLHGMVVLGAVVLCITGGEALYADMGHFGLRPIRLAWSAVVFPGLLLNYLGQCALLLNNPAAAYNPFYEMAPRPLLLPLVALSTGATIIASQALISGSYSLTCQAIQIGFSPRMQIVHTSGETKGQIYLPTVNTAMMIACIGLVIAFRESSRLAAAYGIAVTATMAITTVIYSCVARYNWNWPLWRISLIAVLFLFFDLAFLGANLLKFMDGGWFTVSVALLLALTMATWRDGRALLFRRLETARVPIKVLLEDIQIYKLMRTPGTAAFLSVSPVGTPMALLNYLKHNDALPERVILLSIVASDKPYVPRAERLAITALDHGFHRLVANYGFMETPKMPEILALATQNGLPLDAYSTSFYIGRETILAGTGPGMASWRKRLFAFLSRNAWNASTFFGIPSERVLELGSQVEL
ncbi:MAG: KUP/HAK/KT family potassium transporter, partial [Desulfobulbaceae bacterium]|nr:KUP/HAK/KT family potassium transporter [Desulfobulbaceae bacterium]